MMSCSEKLEDCEVCGKDKAKYTCPKCEVRTCSLTCSNIHKKELECNGIRDKTKFLPVKSMTDLDYISDYCLLQEVGRSVDKYNRDPLKRCTTLNNFLPVFLRKLKSAAFRRGVNLEFMPRSFSRNKQNTTRFLGKKNELLWRIDWIFPEAKNIKWVTVRASENARLSVLIENVLEPEMKAEEDPEALSLKSILRDKLQFYRAAGLNGIKVLMKAEKVQKSNCRFYELDPSLTLTENLEQKTIIEYPTFYVILSHNSDMYEIIDSDDEAEKEVHHQKHSVQRHKFKTNHQKFGKPPSNRDFKQSENGIQNPDEGETGPINLLFHTEFSDSEDEKVQFENEESKNMHQRKRKPKRNQKEYIQKKIQKIRASVNEFTGICKSDSEDEKIAKRKTQETLTPSVEIKSSELITINGNRLVKEKPVEIQKPLTNYFIDSHITDSEDEGPEETLIHRLGSDEIEIEKEKSNISESIDENKNSCDNEKMNAAMQSIAMNYFSAYMSDSDDENISENAPVTLNPLNSGLRIPDYNDLVKMKH